MSETATPTSFASAAAAMPDGGRAVAAELSPSSAPAETATSDASGTHTESDPDPSRGSGSSDATALPSEPVADPNAPKTYEPALIAEARKSFESDPLYAPIFELRNRFSDGDLKDTLPVIEALAQNPVAAVKELIADLQAAGMWEQAETPPAVAAKPFALPDGDLMAEDGTKAYSAKALAEIFTNFQAQIDAKYTGLIDPILKDRESADIQAQAQKVYDAKLTEVSAQVSRARQILPDFKALEPQIKAALEADFKKPAHMQTLKGDFYAAYHEVKQSNPQSIQSADTSRQAVLDDLKKKAEASTARPGNKATAGGDSRPAKSFAELAQRNRGMAQSAASSIVRQ